MTKGVLWPPGLQPWDRPAPAPVQPSSPPWVGSAPGGRPGALGAGAAFLPSWGQMVARATRSLGVPLAAVQWAGEGWHVSV